RGHEVVALCRKPAAFAPGAVTLVFGDILDAGPVHRAAEGCEGAFHCAGKVSREPEDAELLYRTNVEGTKTVLGPCPAPGARRTEEGGRRGRREEGRGLERDRRSAARPDRAVALLPHEALRGDLRARAELRGLRGRERESLAPARPGRRPRLVHRRRAGVPRR